MKLNFLTLKRTPIFEQLQLEEALLRTNQENWCIINTDVPPSIVLGVSAKPHLVINPEIFHLRPIPVVRRFSGGGTVYVDENTLFVTFIFNYPSFPQKVLDWSEEFYRPIFSSIPFQLRENDYTVGEKKFGGNAQYFRKERFLHHTSFLFDYQESNMNYLLYPPKTPQYRQGRSHQDFLTKLTHHFESKEAVIDRISNELATHYKISNCTYQEAQSFLQIAHRKTTTLIEL